MKKIIIVLLIPIFFLSGCATLPYHYGQGIETPNTLSLKASEKQIEQGKPNALVDSLGHYLFSLPSKLILWNWKMDNHDISDETISRLDEYLKSNDLKNVKVRINQYAPFSELNRLFSNHAVGIGWRFTFGLLTWVSYTIMPGRLFGGDNYNPFTNTINVYSDHNAVALHEGAHAKDFAPRKYKGTYAFFRILPIVPLFQESRSTKDALSFYKDKGLIEDEKAGYKVLYPAFGTYIAGEGLRWFAVDPWVRYAIYAGVVIPGHIIGRMKAADVEKQQSQQKTA